MASNRFKRIKWVNKYSGDTGYVKSVLRVDKHFESTFNLEEAKKYKSVKECDDDIIFLNSVGEGDNNNFLIVDVRHEILDIKCKELF